MKHVFKGSRYRVKLDVLDFSDVEWIEKNQFALDRLKKGKDLKCISVEVLSADRHISTAFSKGNQIYFGYSLEDAIKAAIPYLDTGVKLPPKFRRYLKEAWDIHITKIKNHLKRKEI